MDTSDVVYWLEAESTLNLNNTVYLKCIPKEIDEMMYKHFWCKIPPIIMTSATLSANGNFHHFENKLGLNIVNQNRLIKTVKSSPFNFKENCVLYLNEDLPFPDVHDPAYIKAVSDEIERLIKATHGHAMVLFTSYKVMERVFIQLVNRGVGFPFFKVSKNMHQTIDEFRESGNGVLFATGSLWEGIDIAGDVLSALIVVKLPFAVPDPISEFEQTKYESHAEYRKEVIVPEMILKLKQGVGRLIRKETDTGVIAILDPRMQFPFYKKEVIQALPECEVTEKLDDVAAFILEKKSDNYFQSASDE